MKKDFGQLAQLLFPLVLLMMISSQPVFAANKINQKITFTPIASLKVAQTKLLKATSTSKLKVTFKTLTPKICTVKLATLIPITIGTCKIAANQTGNKKYSAAKQVLKAIVISKKQFLSHSKLVLQISGVGKTKTTYTKMTIMDNSGLAIANHQPIQEGNYFHQTMMAWISDLFVQNAQASILPNGCSTRLVGYNQIKKAWEVLKLTTDGSEACAMSFVVAGDYYISQMDAFQIDEGYCNLLMIRKTDGKLFCGLEATPTQYNIFGNDVEISSNDKYGLMSVAAFPMTDLCSLGAQPPCLSAYQPDWSKRTIELLRLDLKSNSGIPAIKVIWAANSKMESDNSIIDSAPTNNGNAFISYSYDGSNFQRFIQVNNNFDDLNSNNFVDLPTLGANANKILSGYSTGYSFLINLTTDPNILSKDTAIIAQTRGNALVTPYSVIVDANNTLDISYRFLGETRVYCGNSGPCMGPSQPYNYQTESFGIFEKEDRGAAPSYPYNYSLSLYKNNLNQDIDLESISIPQYEHIECSIGNGTCTTDIKVTDIAFCNDCSFTAPRWGVKVSWFGSIGWLILTQGTSSNLSLYKIDLESNTSTSIKIPNIKIKTLDASTKYPGDVIVTGIDYKKGITGSPFAARITSNGALVDYSVLPTSFATSSIQVVEL